MYKASFLCILLFIFAHSVYSQAGIGPASPNNDALLDLTVPTSDKGLLLPRVALTSTTAFSPLSAHVQGMFVYNTATAGAGGTAVSPGLYWNDGTQWRAVFLDAIRAQLTTSGSAYDAAAADSWVGITASEYANLQGIFGAAVHGTTTAAMNQSSTSNNAGNNTYSQTNTVNNAPLINASDYVFAFAVKANTGGAVLAGGVIMTSTAINTGYTAVGSALPAYTSTSQGTNYFVRKQPAATASAGGPNYLAYFSPGAVGGIAGGSTNYAAGNATTLGSTNAVTIQIQCISTAVKQW